MRKNLDPNMKPDLSQKIPGKTKIETGKTNLVHFKDPMHAINNADKGRTYK